MAIRFTFHWGPDADLDRHSAPFKEMHSIWPTTRVFAAIEKQKNEGKNPAIGYVNMDLDRTTESYKTLLTLFQISRMRMDDPTYEVDWIYIPTSIQELHLYCPAGEELPWDRSRPTKSKVWRQTAPEWFEGMPYSVVYHGSGPEPSSSKRRRKAIRSQFKPKYFKSKDLCSCGNITCEEPHDGICANCNCK